MAFLKRIALRLWHVENQSGSALVERDDVESERVAVPRFLALGSEGGSPSNGMTKTDYFDWRTSASASQPLLSRSSAIDER